MLALAFALKPLEKSGVQAEIAPSHPVTRPVVASTSSTRVRALVLPPDKQQLSERSQLAVLPKSEPTQSSALNEPR